MRNRLHFLAMGVLLGMTAAARADLIVSIGNYDAHPGDQVTVNVNVTDPSAPALSDIEGMTFTFQIGDSGGSVPKITSINLLTGTVWNGHVTAPSIFTPLGGDSFQYQSRDLLTDIAGDFINANGVLAQVTIDTSGALPGDYALKLVGTATPGRDSAILNGLGNTIQTGFTSGSLRVLSQTIPEPATLLVLTAGAPFLLLRKVRRPVFFLPSS